jgi:hypothetical protein
MSLTKKQKAAVGTQYLAEIDRRIDVRTKAKAKAEGAETQAPSDTNTTLLLTATGELRALGVLGKGAELSRVKEYLSAWQPHFGFVLALPGVSEGEGFLSRVPASKLPKTTALFPKPEDKTRKAALCKELEFLHAMKSGTNIGAFQAYVSRLWDGGDVPRATFLGHFDAYLDSKRGYTCPL